MTKILLIGILLAILSQSNSQSCLDANGQPIHWWIALKVPPKIGKSGYGYYDSSLKTAKFTYIDKKIDEGNTPLTKTLASISSNHYQHIAWNDEKPSNETTTTYAHAKGVIAYKASLNRGFLIDHSIPKYPNYNNGQFSPVVSPSQSVYGQHIMCLSLGLRQLNEIALRMLLTWPFVYAANTTETSQTVHLHTLGKGIFPKDVAHQFEQYHLESVVGYHIHSVYKNAKVNGSMFEDGLTSYLSASLMIVETWGRPLDKSWCQSGRQVLNAQTIRVDGVGWNESDDHSKWVSVPGHYACFGDLNHMASQWKRGGAYFCLSDPLLMKAMALVIESVERC